MTSSTTTGTDTTPATWKATFAAAGIGAVGGLIINAVIAWAGHSLFDVPDEFQPFTIGAYGTFTVLGALIGAIGWRLIVNRSRNARRLLGWLVPTVVAVSLLADVPLFFSDAQPGTTTAGVIGLMLMHVGVAAAAVPAYRRLMPPRS